MPLRAGSTRGGRGGGPPLEMMDKRFTLTVDLDGTSLRLPVVGGGGALERAFGTRP